MTIQFIIGSGQNDSLERIRQKASAWLEKNSRHRVFFIVPNYNKFEQEIALLKLMQGSQPSFSTIRTQVFSLNRLAWYYLQNEGQAASSLSDAGNAMIFRKILQEEEEQLTIFRGEANKDGFLSQLADLYQELAAGNIQTEDLAQMTAGLADETQRLKFSDITRIFQRYEKELASYHIQTKDLVGQFQQKLAADDLPQADLAHTLFIMTGFTRLSGRELSLTALLAEKAQLIVSLLLDRSYPTEKPDPLALFRDSGTLYYQLKQAADRSHIPVLLDERAENGHSRFKGLNDLWIGAKTVDRTAMPLTLWQNLSPGEEVRQLAREIRRLVTEEGYRYQDIQVLSRDLPRYGHLIRRIFHQFAIPFYLDEEQKMAEHPLVEFVQALFAIEQYHYRHNDVFRFLRTELFLPLTTAVKETSDSLRDKIDLAENSCLAYGLQGSAWYRKEAWQFVDYDFDKEELLDSRQVEERVNHIHYLIKDNLPPFFAKIRQAADGRQAAEYFYQFLITAGVEQQLLSWRDQEVALGNLSKARNHEQTWQALINLLEEYVLIYGHDPFDWSVFRAVFMSGLENLVYGKVPSALDQVNINNLELVRTAQAKATFAIGLNDQVFPAKYEQTGILSAEERGLINERLEETQFLTEDASTKVMREPFLAYLVFQSAEEKLYLSYATQDDTQKEVKISPFLRRLHTSLNIPIVENAPLSLKSRPQDYLGTWESLIGDLNLLYREGQDLQEAIPQPWLQAESALLKSPQGEFAKQVFESRKHLNQPKNLKPAQAQALYGKNLYVSISKIERFYNCEYRYFLNDGLNLRERSAYELTPAAAGEFFHDALDKFFKILNQKQLSIHDLSEETLWTIADEVLKAVFGDVRFAILNSTARMNYIRYQLSETIKKVMWGLQQQALRTRFTTTETEVLFGQLGSKQGIPGIELGLDNGGKLFVRGKIDRVDLYQSSANTWLSVVDYKSGDRTFDITEAYYGLALQLVTYLDVAMKDAEKAGLGYSPAGAYYLHVHNPILKPHTDVQLETLKSYKYEGIYRDDPELFQGMDSSLEEKNNSLLYPIRRDKDGNYQKIAQSKDKFYTEKELQLLRDHNQEKLLEAGNKIVTGKIDLNPAYLNKQRVACRYCPFRSVCQFDVMLKENSYHKLEHLNKDEVMKRIEEGETDD